MNFIVIKSTFHDICLHLGSRSISGVNSINSYCCDNAKLSMKTFGNLAIKTLNF